MFLKQTDSLHLRVESVIDCLLSDISNTLFGEDVEGPSPLVAQIELAKHEFSRNIDRHSLNDNHLKLFPALGAFQQDWPLITTIASKTKGSPKEHGHEF